MAEESVPSSGESAAAPTNPPQVDAPSKPRIRRWLTPTRLVLSASVASLLAIALVLVYVFVFVPHVDEAPMSIADGDRDGIPDHVELTGWRSSAGNTYFTDPTLTDTDGDGLTDGEEAGRPVVGVSPEPTYSVISDPTKRDSDDDGLDDPIEIHGWYSATLGRLHTDPMIADADDDGLLDGDEAGPVVSNGAHGITFTGYSHPGYADSDTDGLDDAQEMNYGLNAFSTDTDADGLDDWTEVQTIGSDPGVADTDGDGHSDGFEVTHRDERGLDPLFEDVEITWEEYTKSFLQGLVLGDTAREDSAAWLAGNLLSGGTSFIPGVGWIIGTVADVRDAIGSLIHSDWVGAGFSAVGIVPSLGDATAIPGKVSRFIARNPHLAAEVAGIVVSSSLPKPQKIAVLKVVWKQWGALKKAGADEEALLKLQSSKRVDLDALHSATMRAGHVAGEPAEFMVDLDAGHRHAKQVITQSGAAIATNLRVDLQGCNACGRKSRVLDLVSNRASITVKVGYRMLTSELKEHIRAEAFLIEHGEIEGSHWDFYASLESSQVGASPELLEFLDRHGITYTIHLPITVGK